MSKIQKTIETFPDSKFVFELFFKILHHDLDLVQATLVCTDQFVRVRLQLIQRFARLFESLVDRLLAQRLHANAAVRRIAAVEQTVLVVASLRIVAVIEIHRLILHLHLVLLNLVVHRHKVATQFVDPVQLTVDVRLVHLQNVRRVSHQRIEKVEALTSTSVLEILQLLDLLLHANFGGLQAIADLLQLPYFVILLQVAEPLLLFAHHTLLLHLSRMMVERFLVHKQRNPIPLTLVIQLLLDVVVFEWPLLDRLIAKVFRLILVAVQKVILVIVRTVLVVTILVTRIVTITVRVIAVEVVIDHFWSGDLVVIGLVEVVVFVVCVETVVWVVVLIEVVVKVKVSVEVVRVVELRLLDRPEQVLGSELVIVDYLLLNEIVCIRELCEQTFWERFG